MSELEEEEIVLKKPKKKRQSPEIQRALMEERRGKVATLLKGAMNQTEIAQALGVARSVISDDIAALRKDWARRRQIVDNEFDLDLTRLDDGIRSIYANYKGGSLEHIQVMLKILERRAKMLAYDRPPAKQEFGITGSLDLETDDLHLLTDNQLERLIVVMARKEGIPLDQLGIQLKEEVSLGEDTADEG